MSTVEPDVATVVTSHRFQERPEGMRPIHMSLTGSDRVFCHDCGRGFDSAAELERHVREEQIDG